MYIDSAKTSTMEGAATTVYAQGGKGNPRLIAWEGERTVTFTVEDALISPLSFAMLSGAGLVSAKEGGDPIYVHTTYDLPILDGGLVKLDKDTADDNHIYITSEVPAFGMVLDEGGSGVQPCEISVVADQSMAPTDGGVYKFANDSEVLTLKLEGEAGKYVGSTVRVDCYTQKTEGAVQINIDAQNFAGSYYVEASTLWRDKRNGVDHPAEIVFPNVKIQSNFTFSMAATGDPSTFTFTMDAVPAYTSFDKKTKVFAAIQIIGDDSLTVKENAAAEDEASILFGSIVAGAADFKDGLTFADDTVNFNTLGSNLKATANGSDVHFSGTLKKIENWTAFSSIPADLTGYYMPFKVTAPASAQIVRTTLSGAEKTIGMTAEGYQEIVWAVDPKNPIIRFVLKDGAKTTPYVFDFSRVKFQ